MRRPVVLFATLVLLWTLVSELNHVLSSLHLWIFAGGLYVSYLALTQPLRPGLTVTLLAGLMCDAQAPVAFGTHLLLFAAAHAALFRLRDRIPREDNLAATLVALFANFALFLLLAFTQMPAVPAPAAISPRLIADLICSQVFVALATPWFFALQARAVALADTVAALRTDRSG